MYDLDSYSIVGAPSMLMLRKLTVQFRIFEKRTHHLFNI